MRLLPDTFVASTDVLFKISFSKPLSVNLKERTLGA